MSWDWRIRGKVSEKYLNILAINEQKKNDQNNEYTLIFL